MSTAGDSNSLGWNSFALTLLVFSLINAGGLIDIHASNGVVMGLAVFYGGFGQVLAGMWEFWRGNTFNATLFSSYGGFFLSLAALRMSCFSFLSGYTNERDLHDGYGIFYFAWTLYTLWMLIAAHRTSNTVTLFLFFLFVNFLLLTISQFTATTFPNITIRTQEAGGCFGCMAAFVAWYAAYAALLTKKQSLVQLSLGELDPIYKSWGMLESGEEAAAPAPVAEDAKTN